MTDEEQDKVRAENEAKFLPTGTEVTLRFGNQAAAAHFLHWLSGQGEQDYWLWMEFREKEEGGPITGLRFNYHEPGHGVVTVECGRLDDPDR